MSKFMGMVEALEENIHFVNFLATFNWDFPYFHLKSIPVMNLVQNEFSYFRKMINIDHVMKVSGPIVKYSLKSLA